MKCSVCKRKRPGWQCISGVCSRCRTKPPAPPPVPPPAVIAPSKPVVGVDPGERPLTVGDVRGFIAALLSAR